LCAVIPFSRIKGLAVNIALHLDACRLWARGLASRCAKIAARSIVGGYRLARNVLATIAGVGRKGGRPNWIPIHLERYE